MVSWSFTRCFSANVSAASLFEKRRDNRPAGVAALYLRPRRVLGDDVCALALSMARTKPRPERDRLRISVPSKLTHYVGDSSRRPHPSPDSPGAVPLQTSRHRGHDEAPSPSDQRHSDRRSTTHPIVNRPPFTVTPTVSWPSGRQPLPTGRRPSAEDAAKRLLTVTWIVIATVILCSPTTVFDRMMSPSVW
jgi:hypothetical protein